MYFLYMSDPGNGKFLERGAPCPQMILNKRISQIRKKPCSTQLNASEEGTRLQTSLPTEGSGTQVARSEHLERLLSAKSGTKNRCISQKRGRYQVCMSCKGQRGGGADGNAYNCDDLNPPTSTGLGPK